MVPNRALYYEGEMYDIVFGTLVIVGLTEDNFGSLNDELLDKYYKMFERAETFYRMGEQVFVEKI